MDMDVFLIILGVLLSVIGLAGSFLPVIPGPLTSWFGLLSLYMTSFIPTNKTFLGVTLFFSILIIILDYFIPIWGTKRFGGSKAGAIGTGIGMLIGIFFGPIGILLGPFIGAFAGEMSHQADRKKALKAAFGSFLGFLTGTFLKFTVSLIFLIFFVFKLWEYKSDIL